ncbi:MAG: EamA family transporter [Anaerolineales bacterium]|jgi:drug/metabolite transporter (DMT)-like permease
MFWIVIFLTILSNVFYHIIQKVTPQQANPVLSLAISYLIAGLICFALLPVFPMREGLSEALKQLNWTTVALAFTLVGLEIGFLLAYRAGWTISLAGLFSNATVSVLLLPVGYILFKDRLSGTNMVGVLVAIVGLVLMNWGK